mmetsp:Transcript_89788/g.290579  ORF Transcript_89788/g.290579 Transcript_89788/m.290579 type:complete len:97 (-) Transcript_89788:413-703(-)
MVNPEALGWSMDAIKQPFKSKKAQPAIALVCRVLSALQGRSKFITTGRATFCAQPRAGAALARPRPWQAPCPGAGHASHGKRSYLECEYAVYPGAA